MTVRSDKLFFYQILILIIISGFCAGCAVRQKVIQTNLLVPLKEVEKIPLRVGLYLDSKFVNYSKIYPHGGGIIHMGGALSKEAENIVNKAFKEGVTINTMDSASIPQGLVAIVIPEVERIYGGQGELIRYGYYDIVLVKIKWTIKDLKGKILYLNTFTSEVEFRAMMGDMWPRVCEAYTKAIEDQFKKAYEGITSTNWWESIKRNTDKNSYKARSPKTILFLANTVKRNNDSVHLK